MKGPLPQDGLTANAESCWRLIGVQGDASCPELAKQVHCRNCPVYAAAANELLDRELPPDYESAWTVHFAQRRAVEKSRSSSAVAFRIGSEWLALPTHVLEQIVDLRPVHSLPHRRNGVVLGLVNIGGELLVCVSIGHVIGTTEETKPLRAYEHARDSARELRAVHPRMLVMTRGTSRFVAAVDEVHGIVRYARDELLPPPATVAKSAAVYTAALLPWREKSVGCLDDELLFQSLERSLS